MKQVMQISGAGGSGDISGPSPASSTDEAIVRWDGTGGNTIQNSVVTLSDAGAFNIPSSSAPTTPAAGNVKLYAVTTQGHTTIHHVDEDGMHTQLLRDAVLLVRNTSGSLITKGQTCDIYSATGAIPEIRLADSNTVPPRHCEGFAAENIANNGYGLILLSGEITNLDTSGFTEGASIYQSTTAGAYTETAPTDGSLVQSLGIISRSHATQGSIEIIIALPLIHASVHHSTGVDPIDHGSIAGLTDDDHTQYALLAGRSGGQILRGGTASGDDLTLRSTSNATKGDVFIADEGGNVIIGGGATASRLRMLEPSGSGTNYTEFVAQAQGANITYTLPPDDGDANEVLQTDGAGSLTWVAQSGGVSVLEVQVFS